MWTVSSTRPTFRASRRHPTCRCGHRTNAHTCSHVNLHRTWVSTPPQAPLSAQRTTMRHPMLQEGLNVPMLRSVDAAYTRQLTLARHWGLCVDVLIDSKRAVPEHASRCPGLQAAAGAGPGAADAHVRVQQRGGVLGHPLPGFHLLRPRALLADRCGKKHFSMSLPWTIIFLSA